VKFSVETWAPEYGIAADLESLDEPDEAVDATVERPLDDWAPIAPAPHDLPEVIVFIDGVRRIDARLWIHDGDRSHPGVCASVAAGAVRCTRQHAALDEFLVEHMLVAPARSNGESVSTKHATYAFTPAAGGDPDAVYLAIHQRMTALERALTSADGDLVVFDGPLRGRDVPNGIGYVKTQRVQYVPDAAVATLGRLGDGERTPLLLIAGRSGYARWTWYLRLPGPRTQPLSGVVRCELPARGTAAEATACADQVSAALPRFASQPHKEPRAPQNLTPIAGLEQALRRRLGDPLILERALRTAASSS